MKRRIKAACIAAAVIGLTLTYAAPAAATDRRTPPVAGTCAEGFFMATIAGAVSCQPNPRVVVTPAPVVPPVVEAPTPAPIAQPEAPAPQPAPVPAPVPAPAPVAPTPAPVAPQEITTYPPPTSTIFESRCVFTGGGWACAGVHTIRLF